MTAILAQVSLMWFLTRSVRESIIFFSGDNNKKSLMCVRYIMYRLKIEHAKIARKKASE